MFSGGRLAAVAAAASGDYGKRGWWRGESGRGETERRVAGRMGARAGAGGGDGHAGQLAGRARGAEGTPAAGRGRGAGRSEEHTSELQSRENLVCRLLLEKKNP